MRTTLTALACSLILGLSIGIGPSLAGKEAQTTRAQNVKDVGAQSHLRTMSRNISIQSNKLTSINNHLESIAGQLRIGQESQVSTVRDLLKRICVNGAPPYSSC